MPDSLISPLPPARNDQRRRWAGLIWSTITLVEKGDTPDWTVERLKLIAKEIEPPLKPNGDPQ